PANWPWPRDTAAARHHRHYAPDLPCSAHPPLPALLLRRPDTAAASIAGCLPITTTTIAGIAVAKAPFSPPGTPIGARPAIAFAPATNPASPALLASTPASPYCESIPNPTAECLAWPAPNIPNSDALESVLRGMCFFLFQ